MNDYQGNKPLLSSINGADLSVQDLRLRWMKHKVEILTEGSFYFV